MGIFNSKKKDSDKSFWQGDIMLASDTADCVLSLDYEDFPTIAGNKILTEETVMLSVLVVTDMITPDIKNKKLAKKFMNGYAGNLIYIMEDWYGYNIPQEIFGIRLAYYSKLLKDVTAYERGAALAFGFALIVSEEKYETDFIKLIGYKDTPDVAQKKILEIKPECAKIIPTIMQSLVPNAVKICTDINRTGKIGYYEVDCL